jgi:hypothetical protein
MTQTEFNQIKELISGSNLGISARVESQYLVIDTKLDEMNSHLERLNGSVAKHEAQIAEALIERAKNRESQSHIIEGHILTCPQLPRLEAVEKSALESAVTKKFVMKAVGIGMALPAMVWAVVQIISKLL